MTLQKNYKTIFDNLKDGDCLAFYSNEWFTQIIPLLTKEKGDKEAPQHVGICYDVKKEGSILSFNLSEQSIHGGRFRQINIAKIDNIYYLYEIEDIDYFNKQTKIILLSLKEPVLADKIMLGKQDALKEVGKKYGYSRLILGWEFLEKLLPKKFLSTLLLRLNKNEKLRVCSTHVQFNLIKLGYNLSKDTFLTPLEITKLPIFNVYI